MNWRTADGTAVNDVPDHKQGIKTQTQETTN